ncbi:MAG: hypothetical protein E6J41_04495 [Chloroflexi bacterium]|nr:MAG: hypothetical protein E6J41_04495 [Chloroflexota bacterium]
MAIAAACFVVLTPVVASADNGATSPEPTPFCTVGVDFTWDGATWLSEFPNKNGDLCVAGGVNASAPAGHSTAGAHQVCASAGPRFKDCKSLAVVLVTGAAPATPKPSGLAGAPAPAAAPTAAPTLAPEPGPLAIPSNAPAPAAVRAAVNNLSPQQRELGLALFTVGVLGLLAIAGRRYLLSRRSKPAAALPSPGGQPPPPRRR